MRNKIIRIGFATLFFFLLVELLFISDGFQSESGKTVHDLIMNLAFTLLGIALKVLVIDRLNESRSNVVRKDALIRDLGVGDRSVSFRALNELLKINALTDGSLCGADFTRSEFIEVDLAGLVADKALFIGSKFTKCDLANSFLMKALLNDTVFEKRWMEQSNLDEAWIIQSTFVECDLQSVSISNTILRSSCFKNCEMSPEFRKAALQLGAKVENFK